MTLLHLALAAGIIFLAFAMPISSYNRLIARYNDVMAAWIGLILAQKNKLKTFPHLIRIAEAGGHTELAMQLRHLEHQLSGMSRHIALHDRTMVQMLQIDITSMRIILLLEGISSRSAELSASQHFKHVVRELTEIQGQVHEALIQYNDSVNLFNRHSYGFPGILINKGFAKLEKMQTIAPTTVAGRHA